MKVCVYIFRDGFYIYVYIFLNMKVYDNMCIYFYIWSYSYKRVCIKIIICVKFYMYGYVIIYVGM